MSAEARRLRRDLPFRRLALVLSGGGAMGAYEAGALETLERAGIRPQIVLGVSVGAINAVVWVAHDMRTEPLLRGWRELEPSGIGLRWISLAAGAIGAILVVLATFQLVLVFADMPMLRLIPQIATRVSGIPIGIGSMLAEIAVWLVMAVLGATIAFQSHRIEDAVTRHASAADPERPLRILEQTLIAAAALYVIPALVAVSWPRRAHLMALLVMTLLWIAGRAGRREGWARRLLMHLLPETGGRGLWRGSARRHLMERLIADAPGSPLRPDVNLILSACSVDTGRMHHFVTERDVPAAFRERVAKALGEVFTLQTVDQVLDAAVASSAVPLVFEPAHFNGHDYIDGGVFSNQPLHAVLADGADWLLIVLVSPSGGPPPMSAEPNVLEILSRLPQIANWRDLQSELRQLPEGWSREGDPARVCVVEPTGMLPASLLGIDPSSAERLIQLGADDAWKALAHARWLEPADSPG